MAQVEGQNVEDAQRVSKNPERTLDLFLFPLLASKYEKKEYKTCTFRTCLDPELGLSPCHVWGFAVGVLGSLCQASITRGCCGKCPTLSCRKKQHDVACENGELFRTLCLFVQYWKC